jgi:DNA polymerase-1
VTRSGPGKLVLIDGNSLVYRAFFALPALTNAEGRMTNAAYGFTSMLLKIMDEEQPDMLAVAFDLPGPTFRHERFPEYKATREKMPDELGPQIEMVREILEVMHIPTYEMEGYEADDVIGTLAARGEEAGQEVLVVTGDLDELQLVSERVSVMMTRRGITDTKVYDPEAVRERYGFEPEQLPDFRALRGDTSDNIPGVPGVGDKTAASLVRKFGSLDEVMARLEEVKPARVAGAIEAHGEVARRARELSVIVRDLPVEFDAEVLRVRPPDEERLADLFRRLDFRSLLARLAGPQEQPTTDHELVVEVNAAKQLAGALAKHEEVVVEPVAAEGPALEAGLHGVCVLGLGRGGEAAVVMGEGRKLDRLLAPLRELLESPDIRKVGHDLKRAALLLSRRGITLRGMSFDAMIASHLINPARRSHDLGAVVFEHLAAGGTPQLALGEEADAGAGALAARQVALLKPRLEARLGELELEGLFAEVEMPLVGVLAEMELTGVAVDVDALAALGERLAARAKELEADIYGLAGEEFNIGSPKQLRQILFEKLGLPPDRTKRTKTGYSTGAEVLAGLSEHEIAVKILDYREVTKLKSTYVDALPRLVNAETGRIHTSFNQAVTATGRLSSTNPNLQNIPIRGELGMEIRRAFVAGLPDHVLLSADYSQIELRILAHITEDENLIEIFRRDEDLHRAAASEIFGVGPGDVTPGMRSFAKMVNFGIPYGISDFRLAREMGISVGEAARYRERYFARFPRLGEYVEEMPKEARAQGYVKTLLGRRRPLPELRTRAGGVRRAAERMAVNTPMKLAMLRVRDSLRERGLGAKMTLQVHDELVLETPRAELPETAALVRDCMAEAYELRVPLKVAVKAGGNWLEMEPAA